MSKIVSALVDLATGLLFVLIALISARVLLQDRHLVYFCFPILVTAAIAVGLWRSRILSAFLATVPLLILALYFFSGRNRPFIVFPVVTFVFMWIGTRVKGRAAAAVIVLASIAGAFAGPQFVRLLVPGHDVHEKPIAFTIRLIDGSVVSSQSLRGKVVVLDFWATWCVPCQHELPAIQRVYERNRQNVAFFAIDGVMTDSPGDAGDTVERATAFFRRGGFTIPLAWDGGGVLETSFRLTGFPTLLVLDREGSVRMRHVGFIGGEDLERILSAKIAQL